MKGRSARLRILGLAAASAVGVLAIVSACSNYGEGERCEITNGNDDCANGLVCTSAKALAQPYNTSDRCCPLDRNIATAESCKQATSTIGQNPPPPDSGPAPDATVTDAGDAGDAATSDAADAADAEDSGSDI